MNNLNQTDDINPIDRGIAWANIRLRSMGQELTDTQIEYIRFAIITSINQYYLNNN